MSNLQKDKSVKKSSVLGTHFSPTLSVIIVNYNVRFFLEQCLQSVLDACTQIDAEIIVVDNNSQDDSCAMVKQKFPKVKLIENKQNTGFSTANNQGVAIAKGEYVLILNPDTVVAEDTFEKILTFAKSYKNLGALTVKLIDGTGHFLPESKRGIPTPKVAINKILGLKTDAYYAKNIPKNNNGKIDILVGAFMLMKKSIYNEVNGFDEDYFMYGEDIDLSYKILKKGYDNYYFSETKIIHYKGESTVKNRKYLNNFYGAMKIFYKKHFDLNSLQQLSFAIGIKLIKSIQSLQLKKQKASIKIINKYIYIGKDDATFAKVKKALQPELAIFHQAIDIKNSIANNIDTLIFDNHFITNKEIIDTMERLKNKHIKFRFIPKNTHFIIGSDTSLHKGEIIKF